METLPMSEALPQAVQRRQADLTALQRELEKIARNVKRTGTTAKQRQIESPEPVLVIKGK
jgi:hypothetical protein